MRGEQAQADDQTVLQSLHVIFIEASINDKEKDWRHLSRSCQSIFDSCVLGQQLCRQIGSRDVLIVRWKGIALKAEGADPEFSAYIDLAVGLLDLSVGLED